MLGTVDWHRCNLRPWSRSSPGLGAKTQLVELNADDIAFQTKVKQYYT